MKLSFHNSYNKTNCIIFSAEFVEISGVRNTLHLILTRLEHADTQHALPVQRRFQCQEASAAKGSGKGRYQSSG